MVPPTPVARGPEKQSLRPPGASSSPQSLPSPRLTGPWHCSHRTDRACGSPGTALGWELGGAVCLISGRGLAQGPGGSHTSPFTAGCSLGTAAASPGSGRAPGAVRGPARRVLRAPSAAATHTEQHREGAPQEEGAKEPGRGDWRGGLPHEDALGRAHQWASLHALSRRGLRPPTPGRGLGPPCPAGEGDPAGCGFLPAPV